MINKFCVSICVSVSLKEDLDIKSKPTKKCLQSPNLEYF